MVKQMFGSLRDGRPAERMKMIHHGEQIDR